MKKTFFLILFLALNCQHTVSAQKLVGCDIAAAINNEENFNKQAKMTTDPTGTNIRSGAGKDFPVVKTLKDESGFVFHVTGSQGDWVRVDRVHPITANGEQKLNGWVYAPSLFLKVEHEYGSGQAGKFVSNLYAAPDWKSRLLLPKNNDIGKNGEGFDDIVSLRSCLGKWAKVSWKDKTGWLNPGSQCAALWDFCGER